MIKAGIDQDAIVALFARATARQKGALRQAVCEATLKALQGRELTLENIRRVLKAVGVASSNGVADNPARAATLQSLLSYAVQGMDAALLTAVQANRTALQQFMDLGVGLQSEQMKLALANLDKMEDVFVGVLGKVTQASADVLAGPWTKVLQGVKRDGTRAGTQASLVVAQLVEKSQLALRTGRSANVRAAQAMMDSYGSLVSGVLMGMSEALTSTSAAPPKPPARGNHVRSRTGQMAGPGG